YGSQRTCYGATAPIDSGATAPIDNGAQGAPHHPDSYCLRSLNRQFSAETTIPMLPTRAKRKRPMPSITRASLMTLEAYAKVRKEFRANVMAHKKNRRVH